MLINSESSYWSNASATSEKHECDQQISAHHWSTLSTEQQPGRVGPRPRLWGWTRTSALRLDHQNTASSDGPVWGRWERDSLQTVSYWSRSLHLYCPSVSFCVCAAHFTLRNVKPQHVHTPDVFRPNGSNSGAEWLQSPPSFLRA